MEDEQIVSLFLKRDEDAVRQTADKYGERLRRISFGITADAGTSEECENDTYMEAWNRIPPAEPKTYFYAFLAKIVRALSIDRCRERRALKRTGYLTELNEELEACLPGSGDPETAVDAKLLGEAIGRFLRTVGEEKQVIFLRRYFYLDTIPEISRRLSLGESKVKMTLLRLRNDLRAYLIKEGYSL